MSASESVSRDSGKSRSNNNKKSGSKASESNGQPEEQKKRQRRPLWVAIPATYEDVTEVGEDGDIATKSKPATFRMKSCQNKAEALSFLQQHGVDASNVDDVIVLRANPASFKIESQIQIKF